MNPTDFTNPVWIARRRPVWIALSDLWLDQEKTDAGLNWIAGVMAESPLTLEELRQVYLVEVAPAVYWNLLTVAGVWDGFDEEWLETKILHNLRHHLWRTKFWCWFPLTRAMMTYATEEHWTRLVQLARDSR